MKNNIKYAREQRNMTQKECAEKLNISLRAWQTYEQGVSEPKNDLLLKIADMFNVSLDYLLGRDVGEPSILERLDSEFNMSALENKIIENYLSLPKSMRENVMDFLQRAVREVRSEARAELNNPTDGGE